MDDIKKYELIERYLKGDLNSGELLKVERMIRDDSGFALEVEAHRKLKDLIIDHSLISVKKNLSTIRQNKINNQRRFLRNILFTGSVLVTGLSMFLLLNREKENVTIQSIEKEKSISNELTDTNSQAIYLQNTDEENTGKNVDSTTESIGKVILPNGPFVENNPVPEYIDTVNPDKKLTDNVINPLPVFTPDSILPTTESTDMPCVIKAEYDVEPSCQNQATGSLLLIEESLSGGEPPYKVVLNGSYTDSLVFRNLYPGTYQLAVIDARNCKKEWKKVEIKKKECLSDFRFAPYYGELWDIPLEKEKTGMITIFNRNGFKVFQKRFDGTTVETWTGKNNDEDEMPGGVYPFEIVYSNGSVYRGTVTIVR